MNVNLKKLLIKYGVNNCEILYVASSGFAIYWNKNFVQDIIETLISLMSNKTLVMPTFSFDFCDNGVYDVNKSPTYCGIISSAFMHRPDVKRTIYTPMHNVSIFGNKQSYFLNKIYETSFGHNSFFEDLENFDTGILLIDCSFNDGVPFIHCLEEKECCTYRKYKLFNGKIIDNDGKQNDYIFKRYVRNGKEIIAGSEMEIEIRANMLYVLELIKNELKKKNIIINSVDLDNIVWNMGRKKENIFPCHHTITIFY